MTDRRHLARSGFTLVELLVVIVIIGILVGLAIPAINMVRRRALATRIGMEIKQLESAVEAYREKYGDYPPDFSSFAVVERHVRKVWPRIAQNEFNAFVAVAWPNGINQPSAVDPAEALAFWLGGFSNDPRRPFFGKGGPFILPSGASIPNGVRINEERNKGVFEFDQGRLTMAAASGAGRLSTDGDNDVFPVYPPSGKKAPYVYFDARTYFDATRPQAFQHTFYTHSLYGTVAPYGSDRMKTNPTPPPARLPEWMNPTSFQIISAGLDDHFGRYQDVSRQLKLFPSGRVFANGSVGPTGYTLEDEDNISNFSDGRQLKDLMP